MSNNGYKRFTTLREYYIDADGNKIYTGTTKANTLGDPDYIPPILDYGTCPLPPSSPIIVPGVTPTLRPTEWIGDEISAYCEDGTSRPRIWIGEEDSAYCEYVIENSNIPTPNNGYESMILSSYIKDVSIYEGQDGEIEVLVSNGQPPFQYSLNGIDFQSTNIIENLSAGNYFILVKDLFNNTNVINCVIKQPEIPHSVSFDLGNGILFDNSYSNVIKNNGESEVDIDIIIKYTDNNCEEVGQSIILNNRLLLVLYDSFPINEIDFVIGLSTIKIKTDGTVWLIGGSGVCEIDKIITLNLTNLKYKTQ